MEIIIHNSDRNIQISLLCQLINRSCILFVFFLHWTHSVPNYMIGNKTKQNCICYKLAVKGKVSGRTPDLTGKSRAQPPVGELSSLFYFIVGELCGEWGKQVESMSEESQVRGCYNFLFAPTRKQCLCWKRHKQTKRLEHESKRKD